VQVLFGGLIVKMNADNNPRLRTDLELFPIRHGNEQLIVIRDHLGLVQDGKALPLAFYSLISKLDGTKGIRDIQADLMRESGGVLVGTDEIGHLLEQLDESFLLDNERFQRAREKVIGQFASEKVRPCSHCGRSYPDQPGALKNRLDEILKTQSMVPKSAGRVKALIAPHIDIAVGYRVYGNAYQWLRNASPSRVIVMGVGHKMMEGLFCLTEKDFQTPLGRVKNDRGTVGKLMEAGNSIISDNDFAHKAEHSVEFQIIFLQHLLARDSFTIVPILCGPVNGTLSQYARDSYLKTATPFLQVLADILGDGDEETLLVTGVDLSHIGPKFGHNKPALYIEKLSERHDHRLLEAVSKGDAKGFWEESASVDDQFNVCGFSAMACLLEVLPYSEGQIIDYQIWHEEATRSAVSFAAVVFTSPAEGEGSNLS